MKQAQNMTHIFCLGPRLQQTHACRPIAQKDAALDEIAAENPHLGSNGRKDLLRTCWNLYTDRASQEQTLSRFDGYLRHYEESCTHLSVAHPSLKDCKHEQFCQAAQSLYQNTRKSCESDILAMFSVVLGGPEAAKDCIDFVGKSLLLLNLSSWKADETLRDFVTRKIASSSIQQDQYRISQSFNARSFEEKAGINIIWTRDFLSHLDVNSNKSRLALFHHVSVLHLYEQSNLKEIFPDGFLEETVRTLSVMLPIADKKCMKWFASKQQKLGLDVAAGDCRHLQATQRNISDFDFWRDRLIIAKDVFDSSQPSGISRIWNDDRNKTQWWTFWIAILVLLLTLVGVIEGALQVYKAYHPSEP